MVFELNTACKTEFERTKLLLIAEYIYIYIYIIYMYIYIHTYIYNYMFIYYVYYECISGAILGEN